MHDGLRHAGFILQCQENKSLGGSRTLTDDHCAGGRDPTSIRDAFQIAGGDDVVAHQLLAEMLDQMGTGGELHAVVIGEGLVAGGHFWERGVGSWG